MLTIRLTRKGKKNQPFFRVVLVDKRRSSTGGRAVEDLGYKNPLTKKISLNKERILYWISKGAQPSATIHNLLIAEKIIDEKKIHVSKLSKKAKEAIKKAETEKAAAVAPAQSPAGNEAGDSAESKPAETPAPAVAPVEAPKEEPKPEEKPAQ